MKIFPSLFAIVLLASGCSQSQAHSETLARRFPPRGSINEFGQLHVTQTSSGGYKVEVEPFVEHAIYKLTISDSSDSDGKCKPFEIDTNQTLSMERNNLKSDFVHFVRVCVYFDEGDSGAVSLVLANDALHLGLTKERLEQFR